MVRSLHPFRDYPGMKILSVSSIYQPNERGGAERTMRFLAEGLARTGHQSVVVSLSPDKAWRQTLNGVDAIYLPLANVYWPFFGEKKRWLAPIWHALETYNPIMGLRFGRILDEQTPDVVHFHNLLGFSVAAWVAARRRSIPIVQTVHDYYLGCANSTMFRRNRNCARQCTECRVLSYPRRRLAHLPYAVTAVSHRALGRLQGCGAVFPSTPTAIIRGCNIAASGQPAARTRRSGQPLRLGFLGRLDPLKGIEDLLTALSKVPSELVELVIGGKGAAGFEAHLRTIQCGGNVKFLGFVEPEIFFDRIDVLVTPSRWEDPLPRVVHEAMSHGVPVIGANIGGIPEMIESGKTGYLFNPGDTDGLRKLILKIAEADFDLAPLQDACYRRSDDYRFEKIFDEYMTVLRHAADRKPLPLSIESFRSPG